MQPVLDDSWPAKLLAVQSIMLLAAVLVLGLALLRQATDKQQRHMHGARIQGSCTYLMHICLYLKDVRQLLYLYKLHAAAVRFMTLHSGINDVLHTSCSRRVIARTAEEQSEVRIRM
eukprot:18023-Heterococcus_DN1.PRE.8